MEKNSFRGLIFAFDATPESGALKANALPDGWERLTVCAVKGAAFAFIGAKRRPLTGEAGGSGAGFKQEGQGGGSDVTNSALRRCTNRWSRSKRL